MFENIEWVFIFCYLFIKRPCFYLHNINCRHWFEASYCILWKLNKLNLERLKVEQWLDWLIELLLSTSSLRRWKNNEETWHHRSSQMILCFCRFSFVGGKELKWMQFFDKWKYLFLQKCSVLGKTGLQTIKKAGSICSSI